MAARIQSAFKDRMMEIAPGDLIGGAALGFGVIDQVDDDVAAAAAGALADAGPGDGDGTSGLADPGAANEAADWHDVALALQEVADNEVADQRLVDRGGREVEVGQVLDHRQTVARHLADEPNKPRGAEIFRPKSLTLDLLNCMKIIAASCVILSTTYSGARAWLPSANR